MDESHRGKTMRKQAVYMMIIVVTLSLFIYTTVHTVSSSTPSKLQIYVEPPQVLADNNAYEAIFVQLQDSNGLPARAQANIDILLSSSLTNVGSVDPKITITAGSTYAIATFHSTYTPGSTTITAAATGFTPEFASITTVGPIPSKLAIYSLPPTLPADGRAYKSVVVQLQDAGGLPAKAPIGNVNVMLTSSNLSVGNVDSSVLITAGDTYAVATFYTNGIGTGSAVITALSSGYVTGQTTVKTDSLAADATTLKVCVGPPTVPADGVAYDMIAVQLQDDSGKIANATSNITVFLSSSKLAVGTVNSSILIMANTTYSVAKFYSTYKSETTSITAAAADYVSSQESLTTVGPIPTKLAVYCAPPKLPADSRSYQAIVVQLQDSAGNPARDPNGNVTVELLSSMPRIGNVTSPLVILYGQTHSAANFTSTFDAGSAGITALTQDYSTAQSAMTTYVIDQYSLVVTVTADPISVNSSGQTTIRAYVAYGGIFPAPGATIQFESDEGGDFSLMTDEGNGNYTSIFTAPDVTTQTVCTISVNASKPGYVAGHGSVLVTVNPYTLAVSATALPNSVKSSGQATVKIYLVDDNLNPTSGATLQLASDNGGNFSAAIDEGNGNYTSVFTAPDVSVQTVCTISVNASKSGYVAGQGSAQVTVNPYGLSVSATVLPSSVNSGGQVTLTVYVADDSLSPTSGVTLQLVSDSGGNFSVVTDQGNGNYTSVFSAPNVTAQTVCTISVNASKLGYITGNGTAQVTVNSAVYLGGLKLYIKDAGGSPIEGATVTSTSQPSGISSLSAMTDSDGYVGFEGIPAGTYIFEIAKDGYEMTNETVQVVPAQAASYTVNLAGSASGLPLPILIIVIIAVTMATGLAATLILRRRRKPALEEEPAAEA
jgi:adhesin/invasin